MLRYRHNAKQVSKASFELVQSLVVLYTTAHQHKYNGYGDTPI